MAFSIGLAVVLLALLVISIYLMGKKKYNEIVCLGICLLTFFPTDAVGLISGKPYNTPGIVNVSIIAYYVVILFFVNAIVRGGKLRVKKSILHVNIISMMAIFMIRLLANGVSAFSNKMIDNYFIPMLFFVFIVSNISILDLKKILRCLFVCIMINAVIACIEFYVGKSLFFHGYYMENVHWYYSIYNATMYGDLFRTTALLGHPLNCGVYYYLGLVYLLHFIKERRIFVNFLFALILGVAIISTNARSVIVFSILYIFYFFFKNKKYGMLLTTSFGAILFLFNNDVVNIYNKLFSRDVGGGSLAIRFKAIFSIGSVPFETLLFGTGYNKTGFLLNALGFNSNFEVSYLIILVENGIIGFLIWFFLLYKNINRVNLKTNIKWRNTILDLLYGFLIIGMMSNSFADPGTLNYLLWLLLAFTHFALPLNEKRKIMINS